MSAEARAVADSGSTMRPGAVSDEDATNFLTRQAVGTGILWGGGQGFVSLKGCFFLKLLPLVAGNIMIAGWQRLCLT